MERLLNLQLSATAVHRFHQVKVVPSCKVGCKEILTTYKLKEVKRASRFATTVGPARRTSLECCERPHATFPSSSISQTVDPPHLLIRSTPPFSRFLGSYWPFIRLLPDWFLTRKASLTAVLMTANERTEFSSFPSSRSARGCVETPARVPGHSPADSRLSHHICAAPMAGLVPLHTRRASQHANQSALDYFFLKKKQNWPATMPNYFSPLACQQDGQPPIPINSLQKVL